MPARRLAPAVPRASRAVAAALCVAAVAAGRPRAARACSCVPPRMQRLTLPADGATDVPTNAAIRVFLTGGFPPELRAALADEYRLRGPDGALVPLSARVVATRLDLTPAAPLRPRARYTLERLYAYDAAGVRLSDTARWWLALRPQAHGDLGVAAGPVRVAWFPAVRFTTGAGPAAQLAAARSGGRATVRIARVRRSFAYGGGDCGPAMTVAVDYAPPAGLTPLDVVEVEVRGEGVVWTRPAVDGGQPAARAIVSDGLCNPDPVVLPDTRATVVRVAVVGPDGARRATSRWARAAHRPARPLPAGRRDRLRRNAGAAIRAALGAWRAATVVDPGPARPVGPTACPHGFASERSRRVAPDGGPRTYADPAIVGWAGGRAWLALRDPRAGRIALVGVPPAGAPSPRAHVGAPGAFVAAALVDASGALIVSQHDDGRSQGPMSTLHAVGVDGAVRWTRPLGRAGDRFRLASGGGRALVAWTRRVGVLERRLAWTLVDAATGREVAGGVSSVAGDADATPGAAFAGDQFAIAAVGGGPGAAPVHWLTVPADGTPATARTLPLTGYGAVDLAAAGDRIAIALAARGTAYWALADPRGRLVAGPVDVSAGVGTRDNRKPRVAWNGRVFGVVWEAFRTRKTYAVAVGLDGAVSDPLALAAGGPSSTPGVAAAAGGFVATFSVDTPGGAVAPHVEWLRCRATPPAGAPRRIAPLR